MQRKHLECKKYSPVLFEACEELTYNLSPCFAFLSETRYTLPKLPLPSFLSIVYLLAIIASEQAELDLPTVTCFAVSWNFSIVRVTETTDFSRMQLSNPFTLPWMFRGNTSNRKKNCQWLFLWKCSLNSIAVFIVLSLQHNKIKCNH